MKNLNHLNNQSIAEMKKIAKAKTGKTAEEIYQEEIKDFEIKEFLKKYDISDDEDAYQYSKSQIHEYYNQRDKDPNFKPSLELYNDRIHVSYTFRNSSTEERYFKRPRFNYDISTNHLKGLSFSDIELTTGNSNVVNKLTEFQNNLSNGKFSKGLWVVGSNGIGKTYLMGCFLGELKKMNKSYEIIGAQQFLNDLYSYMRQDGRNLEKRKKDLSINANILIIDDMGVDKASDFTVSTWLDILQVRYDNNLPTFVTSNLTKADYCSALIQKGVDRPSVERFYKKVIEPLFIEIGMSGENKRKIS